jgi:hypothetical protein
VGKDKREGIGCAVIFEQLFLHIENKNLNLQKQKSVLPWDSLSTERIMVSGESRTAISLTSQGC